MFSFSDCFLYCLLFITILQTYGSTSSSLIHSPSSKQKFFLSASFLASLILLYQLDFLKKIILLQSATSFTHLIISQIFYMISIIEPYRFSFSYTFPFLICLSFKSWYKLVFCSCLLRFLHYVHQLSSLTYCMTLVFTCIQKDVASPRCPKASILYLNI